MMPVRRGALLSLRSAQSKKRRSKPPAASDSYFASKRKVSVYRRSRRAYPLRPRRCCVVCHRFPAACCHHERVCHGQMACRHYPAIGNGSLTGDMAGIRLSAAVPHNSRSADNSALRPAHESGSCPTRDGSPNKPTAPLLERCHCKNTPARNNPAGRRHKERNCSSRMDTGVACQT